MIIRAKLVVALSAMVLVTAVISLPVFSLAATPPAVTVLSQLTNGLITPVNIALDVEGNIFVSDPRNGGVVKLNAYGLPQMLIPTAAVPAGLAFAQDGTLLVSQGASVVRYNASTGQEVGRLSGGELLKPAGIAINDVTGYIYVADGVANQVVVYTASGNYVKAFAKGVTADAFGNTISNPLGKLSGPSGISYEKLSGLFAVADTISNRVQFFDADGNFVKSIGKPIPLNADGSTTPVGPMQFDAPVAIAFEYSKGQVPVVLNRIYILDAFQGNIQVIDPATSSAPVVTGPQTTTYIGGRGTRNGTLLVPSDVLFDAVNNRLMVVNGYGNITNYGIDGGKNPTDTTAPVLGIDPVPATVFVPNVTISGTVEAGAVVKVITGVSTVAGAVVYTTPTTWKCDVTGLVAGSNVISVTASDAAGNITPAQSVNVVFQLQLPAPKMSISSIPGLTNVPALLLSGTVDDGAAVTVTSKTTSVSGSATVAGTVWTYTVALAEGVNSIAVTAQKPNSAVAEAELNILLDSVPPALAVSALSTGSYTSIQVQNLTGNVSEASIVTVLVNDVPVPETLDSVLDVGGVLSVPVSLVAGTNVITVKARDLAGNITVNTRNIIYDATSPQINITNPMDNSFTNNAALQINGTVNEAASVIVAGESVFVDNSNKWSATVNLLTGLNTIEVVATDLAGNSSALKRTITLDTEKPALAIDSPVQDRALNQPSIDIAGTVDDSNDITLAYSANGTSASVPVTAGRFSFKVDFAVEGVYPVAVTATDLAGNTTTVTRSLIYDITPPVLTLDAIKWQAHALGGKISGTVDSGSTVTVKEGDANIAKVTVEGNKWTADLSGLTYNQAKIRVVAIDAAGNITSKLIKENGK